MKRTSRGFTIPELLIVVAIIAVLVAIAIPILNKKLEKSREAYDVYTMRQAASVAVDLYYEGIEEAISAGELVWWDQGDAERNNAAGVYNPGAGTFSGIKSENAKRAYGKGTEIDTGATYTYNGKDKIYAPDCDYTKAVVMVAIYPQAENPHIDVYWKIRGGNYVGKDQGKDRPKYSIRLYID